jgi:Zn-dependent peptidase ImmA (M78 family)
MSWVEPKTLQKLRERLGLRREDVEKEAKKLARGHYVALTAARLEAYEQGRAVPELQELETLSEVYGCPVGYFLLDEPPQVSLPLSFRGLAPGKEKHFSPQTQRTLERFFELAEWIATLIEEHSLAWEVKVKRVGTVRPSLDEIVGEERSKLGFEETVRKSWKSAQEALAWWRQRIEEQGVFCLQMKLETKDVRGASAWLKGRYPFVLINHQDAEAATGRLFTLLHEYAHLLLGRDGIACDFRGRDPGGRIEPIANRFAAQILLPSQVFEQYLWQSGANAYKASWTDSELDRMRKPFLVSRDVVSIRLGEMRLAPPDFYQRKLRGWEQAYAARKPWGRGGRPLTKRQRRAAEFGSSVLRAFLSLKDKGALPILETAYALDMKVEKVGEFLDWSRTSVVARR